MYVFYRSFVVLVLTFRYMIHFKLISICYTYTNTHTFFTNGYPILLALCWGDQSFPMGIFFFILSHWFMCILSPIPYCLDYWGFIVSCESGSISSQMLFSLFRTVLPFSHPRSFAIPCKFSISLSFDHHLILKSVLNLSKVLLEFR